MQQILWNSFGRVMGITDVQQFGDCKNRQWIVEWTSMGGDKRPLEGVVLVSDLTTPDSDNRISLLGLNASVEIETIQDGGVVVGPLTSEFLQTAETSPQVRIEDGYPLTTFAMEYSNFFSIPSLYTMRIIILMFTSYTFLICL